MNSRGGGGEGFCWLLHGWWDCMRWASPKGAIEQSRVPVLIIAGTVDRNIQMHHSQELEKACGSRCELWIVPGADHGAASTVARAEFDARVMGWIEGHDAAAAN